MAVVERRGPPLRARTALVDRGLDRGLLPELPTEERALKAAAKESQVGHVDYLVRLGKEDPAEVVFAIVHESREADGSLSYTQEARVRLDRIREHLVTDSPSHQLVAAICSGFERLRLTHTTDDVRRAVTKTLRSFCAVPLRESGGIYWVLGLIRFRGRQRRGGYGVQHGGRVEGAAASSELHRRVQG